MSFFGASAASNSNSASKQPFSIDDAFDIPEEIDEDLQNNHQHQQASNGGNASKNGQKYLQSEVPIIRNERLRLAESGSLTNSDSASLIQAPVPRNEYYEGPTQEKLKYWWLHPKIRTNWKLFSAALCLVLLGFALLIGGVAALALPETPGVQGAVFLIAGVICFVPGAYHIGYIYLAVKGKRGFEFSHLPLFNN